MAVKKKNQSGSKQQESKTGADKLFDSLHPNNMLNNAQKVINSAVNVLEEEIAAGILAAKRIEKKMINVEEVRDDSQNLMNRIRKDTHEALDIFLDALAALSKQVGILTDSVSKENNGGAKADAFRPGANSSVQMVDHDGPVSAGSTITLSFVLSDDTIKVPVQLDLQKTDFSGPDNQKVPVKNLTVDPSSFLLNPGEEKEVTIQVRLPRICAPGQYNSILTVKQMPDVKVVLSFEVQEGGEEGRSLKV
ncbi:hypothetical protein LZZ85_03935 [Terrimonas sp. NA20]|uniref:DUF4469 domain-containing protein n=1 Tax=Terrimonas ginsenosidimutans TaxID=2908004 RepID=A0ABS9KM65_9BACT|nr:hypothetical protein [Terrimonas ginsenosidimutans]MCG2613412.1 hypothetical protein [Terrimonas ginsenosidimutans]